LDVGEDGGDMEVSKAVNVQEVAVWRFDRTLELVNALLGLGI
jgi:hypothetical protein